MLVRIPLAHSAWSFWFGSSSKICKWRRRTQRIQATRIFSSLRPFWSWTLASCRPRRLWTFWSPRNSATHKLVEGYEEKKQIHMTKTITSLVDVGSMVPRIYRRGEEKIRCMDASAAWRKRSFLRNAFNHSNFIAKQPKTTSHHWNQINTRQSVASEVLFLVGSLTLYWAWWVKVLSAGLLYKFS